MALGIGTNISSLDRLGCTKTTRQWTLTCMSGVEEANFRWSGRGRVVETIMARIERQENLIFNYIHDNDIRDHYCRSSRFNA